jgi:hypothetical protein
MAVVAQTRLGHQIQDICIAGAPLIESAFSMQISAAPPCHDLRLCRRLDRRPRRNRTGAPTEGGRVRKDIPREDYGHQGRTAAAWGSPAILFVDPKTQTIVGGRSN